MRWLKEIDIQHLRLMSIRATCETRPLGASVALLPPLPSMCAPRARLALSQPVDLELVEVSTRAPSRGAVRCSSAPSRWPCCFDPRAPRQARLSPTESRTEAHTVSLRAPRARRVLPPLRDGDVLHVSICAPRARRARPSRRRCAGSASSFNPRAPREARSRAPKLRPLKRLLRAGREPISAGSSPAAPSVGAVLQVSPATALTSIANSPGNARELRVRDSVVKEPTARRALRCA